MDYTHHCTLYYAHAIVDMVPFWPWSILSSTIHTNRISDILAFKGAIDLFYKKYKSDFVAREKGMENLPKKVGDWEEVAIPLFRHNFLISTETGKK